MLRLKRVCDCLFIESTDKNGVTYCNGLSYNNLSRRRRREKKRQLETKSVSTESRAFFQSCCTALSVWRVAVMVRTLGASKDPRVAAEGDLSLCR